MIIFFRLDVSSKIGTGHLVRCSALADEFTKRNAKCFFFVRDLDIDVRKTILSAGNDCVLLDPNLSLAGEEFLKEVELKRPSLIVFDHYEINSDFESKCSQFSKVLVIDDLRGRNHVYDFFVDPSYRESDSAIKTEHIGDGEMLGPKFALLRSEFRLFREQKKLLNKGRPKATRPRIMVFFGGTDPLGAYSSFFKLVEDKPHYFSGKDWKVVMTKNHPNFALKLPEFIQILRQPNMAEVMISSDFYFGSGGTVTYERMCLGLSGIVFAMADNQIPMSRALSLAGYHHFMGIFSQENLEKGLKFLQQAHLDAETFHQQSRISEDLVDGMGIPRIVDIIMGNYK